MKNVLLVAYDNCMARIRAALKAHDDIRLFGQEVDNLAFALIAPLGSNQYCIHGEYYIIITRLGATAPINIY
jgi:hypothetical protein